MKGGGSDPRRAVRVGKKAVAAVAAVGVAEAVVFAATLLLLRLAVDAIVVSVASRSTFAWSVGSLVGLALVGAVVRAIRFSLAERIGYRYVRRLRIMMYGHLQRMSARQLLNNSRGAILLRFLGDLSAIRTWVSRGFARAISGTIVVAGGIAMLAYIDGFIALVVAGMLIAGAGLSIPAGRRVYESFRLVRRQRANLATNITEQLHGLSSVQTMGRAGGEHARLGRQNDRLTDRLLSYAANRGVLRGYWSASGSLAVVAVLAAGGLSVNSGRTTVGGVVAAMLATRYLEGPVREIGLSFDYYQAARISRRKILSFMMRPYREADGETGEELRVSRGAIEFQDVVLRGALAGVTGEILPRQVVALVGPNGSGKTSLLGVVARLFEPHSGRVLIDGQELGVCSLASCTREISMVSPMLPLLRGTLRRNLTYRRRSVPERELEHVIDLCGIRDIIDRYPRGLMTAVKEAGSNLPAGYRARISLARGVMGFPKILLLDDPTNGLDQEGKERVYALLRHYRGTILLATHDVTEAAMADVVWRMEDGRVVERLSGLEFAESIAYDVALPDWCRAAGY
jgi:ATP-binding cassette subfamily B protein